MLNWALRPRWAAALALSTFAVLAGAVAWVRTPHEDEVFYSVPGYDLLVRGQAGLPLMEPTGTTFSRQTYPGVNERLYITSVLHFLLSSVWYRAAGFSVESMRALSILWGLVLLAAWYVLLRRLFQPPAVAAWGAGLMAVNQAVVLAGASGRPDMACAGLGTAALAVFLHWRERRFLLAVAASHLLAGATLAIHIQGVHYALALAVVTLWFDTRRLRPVHVLCALAGYAAVLLPWYLYFRSGGADAEGQAAFMASVRLGGNPGVLPNFVREIVERYGPPFRSFSSPAAYAKLWVPLCYLLGLAGVLASAPLRAAGPVRLLLLLAGLRFAVMAQVDYFYKPSYYLVHAVPLAVALLAVWVQYYRPAAGAAALYALVNLLWTASLIPRGSLRTDFPETGRYLAARMAPGEYVFASSQFGFLLGFHSGRVVHDGQLGYHTGKRAAWIVVDDAGFGEAFRSYAVSNPPLAGYIRQLLSEQYELVRPGANYSVYRRRKRPPQPLSLERAGPVT